jgi:signal transduction histidine kinase
MLLMGDDGRVLVVNAAFFHLAESAEWLGQPGAPTDLAGMELRELLSRWQRTASFPPGELELLHCGLADVAAGVERFVRGQLNGMGAGASSLEWSVLRATREGTATAEGEKIPHSWPILLTVRDISAAKEAERLRNDLTNMMVHDLRSPLTSIISSLDLTFRGVIGGITTQQRDVLTIAHASAQRLLNMINLLLDISRLEGGHMPLELAEQAPQALVNAALVNLQLMAEERGVELRIKVGATCRVLADRELVLRVLQNLLDNALKFSPRGSAVSVAAARDSGLPGMMRFAVSDSGIGIKAQDLEQIFAKFGQVGNRRSAGSGLGLTFCKLVVEAHGGRIWVESEPGRGSSFYFTLPCAADVAPDARTPIAGSTTI